MKDYKRNAFINDVLFLEAETVQVITKKIYIRNNKIEPRNKCSNVAQKHAYSAD